MKAAEAGRVLWKTMFGQVTEMSPEDLNQFRKENPEGSYTLLDVRQPGEYQEQHIPGAKLIPLPQLADRLDELDPDKPLAAYCAIGGRSRAAVELLEGRGFKHVYNLTGGIKAWHGAPARGAESSGLSLVSGDETLAQMLALAHGLEAGLKAFYGVMAEQAGEGPAKELLARLHDMEQLHVEKVYQLFMDAEPSARDIELLAQGSGSMVEGGFDPGELADFMGGPDAQPEHILDLAMMIEAQGLDLYLRMADVETKSGVKQALEELAQDEKDHLAALGGLREDLTR